MKRIFLVGGGGEYRFALTGLQEGTATITFTYARAWEDKAPLYTLTYQVRVDADMNVAILGCSFDW